MVTDSFGVAAIVVGSSLGLFTAFVLWRRTPASVGLSCAAVAGATIGAGALLVQDARGAADWIVTSTALGILLPMHAWLLFGPAGRST